VKCFSGFDGIKAGLQLFARALEVLATNSAKAKSAFAASSCTIRLNSNWRSAASLYIYQPFTIR
jgi:hypothetical protein